MQTRTETLQTKKSRSRKSPRGKILTLKERLLAIKAYYRKPVYSKIAKRFKCDWEQIKTIIKERKAILEYYEMATAHVETLTNEEILMRRQKITLLGGCMYEYIQRAQYHKNAMLDEKVLLAQAAEFSYFLQIKNFFPTKSWLKQFKISYNIPLSVKQIELNRIPPVSLNPKNIMTHCKRLVKRKNGQTKNNPQADSDSQAENTSTSTKTSKTTKGHTTVESESRKQRRQKINLLEKALYEYIQRAQFHRNAPLNEDLHIKIACELNDMLNIENFTPNKNWIKHFKLHFNINTSQRKIVVNRIPPYSLNLNDILSYCSDKEAESSNASATIPTELEHKATEIVEKVDENQQNQQPKIILNSRVQPENIMTLEFHNVGEVDIKPDISDIEIEFLEADEEMEQPALKIRKIESMHIDKINTEESANTSGHGSSEEDIKPNITDIEFEILDVDDDKEVEQPALKIRKIESMHVDKINTKESASSCGHISDEEDIKPNISDIEFEKVNDDDDDKEVEQPVLQMQEFESIQVEPSTESQQRSDNEKTPSKHDANDCDNSFIQEADPEFETIYNNKPCNIKSELELFEMEFQSDDDIHMNYIGGIEKVKDTCQQNQQQVHLHSSESFENIAKSLQQSLKSTEIKQQELITRLEKIEKNQEILLSTTAQIITMLEKKFTETEQKPLTQTLETATEPNLIFKKICNVNELNQFETNLNDEDFKASIIEQLKLVCGADGKSDGVTCAYHLSDTMLERNFLTKLSWAGGSKSAEAKHALKTYSKFLQLFFDLILLADNQFNELQLLKFFKTILKNSKQRATNNTSWTGKKKSEIFGQVLCDHYQKF